MAKAKKQASLGRKQDRARVAGGQDYEVQYEAKKTRRSAEWRGEDGQSETEQPEHSASLGDSITSSTRIRFSAHTASSS
jgi:hypothetical protein